MGVIGHGDAEPGLAICELNLFHPFLPMTDSISHGTACWFY
jgi:hypothetical protein